MDSFGKPYPVSLSVDHPEQPRNRLTVFFRLILVLPILAVVACLIGVGWETHLRHGVSYGSAGFVFLPTVLMLLFRQKYPRWWFDWNLYLHRFLLRVSAYLGLLRDEYPSTDDEQAIRLDVTFPDAKTELNRWLPLVKWLLAIPHIIVLVFLDIAAYVCVIIAWFAILFTGRYPRSLFDFVVAVMRWQMRVTWYALLLATDQYPPFSLQG